MTIKVKAKNLTLIIITVAFIVGCVGAFLPSFNMEGFISFIKAGTPSIVTLFTSIGVSSVVDKVKENKCVGKDKEVD